MLITITFSSRQEVMSLHKKLSLAKMKSLHMELKDQTLKIEATIKERTCRTELIKLFIDFIMDMFEKKWLVDILENQFYFKYPEEKEEILDIVYAIFDGEKEDLPDVEHLPNRREIIARDLDEIFLHSSTFSFESLKTFRLSKYRACLRRYVELAIDEYKLQQEYLTFVDKLRRIIRSYRSLHHTIYVLDDKPFRLFDENHKLIQNTHSIRSFYPLLKQWGIDAEPSILLTLIGLAPQYVNVYTDRPDTGMMRTLKHVFEERVQFFPRQKKISTEKVLNPK
ncbi:putative sporulation protein YtxC [Terrilactibacillus laevilacticus]|uniref:putative sporulation protein YtxC n=1 Tax=Terrilactibacillus laevilacticus TaxID=1380157 RepID=UPI00215A5B51|nr:putative sporulation protein YtxC [Terrilactibacillus laevilacticus]